MKTAATIGTVIILLLIGFSWLRGKALDAASHDTIQHVDEPIPVPPASLSQLVDPVKPPLRGRSSWAERALDEAGEDR